MAHSRDNGGFGSGRRTKGISHVCPVDITDLAVVSDLLVIPFSPICSFAKRKLIEICGSAGAGIESCCCSSGSYNVTTILIDGSVIEALANPMEQELAVNFALQGLLQFIH
jgi:hypothetical protein